MMHLLHINCFEGIFSFKNELSGYDLFVFIILSTLVLAFLSSYYRKISKEYIIKLNVCGSKYDLKEILLQDITSERNYLQGEREYFNFGKSNHLYFNNGSCFNSFIYTFWNTMIYN